MMFLFNLFIALINLDCFLAGTSFVKNGAHTSFSSLLTESIITFSPVSFFMYKTFFSFTFILTDKNPFDTLASFIYGFSFNLFLTSMLITLKNDGSLSKDAAFIISESDNISFPVTSILLIGTSINL